MKNKNEKQQDEMEEIFNHIDTAIVKVQKEHEGEDWSGIIECPRCGEDLNVSIAGSYNGHVHGKCITENCLHWSQ